MRLQFFEPVLEGIRAVAKEFEAGPDEGRDGDEGGGEEESAQQHGVSHPPKISDSRSSGSRQYRSAQKQQHRSETYCRSGPYTAGGYIRASGSRIPGQPPPAWRKGGPPRIAAVRWPPSFWRPGSAARESAAPDSPIPGPCWRPSAAAGLAR